MLTVACATHACITNADKLEGQWGHNCGSPAVAR